MCDHSEATSSPDSGALGVAPSGGRPTKPTRSASAGTVVDATSGGTVVDAGSSAVPTRSDVTPGETVQTNATTTATPAAPAVMRRFRRLRWRRRRNPSKVGSGASNSGASRSSASNLSVLMGIDHLLLHAGAGARREGADRGGTEAEHSACLLGRIVQDRGEQDGGALLGLKLQE